MNTTASHRVNMGARETATIVHFVDEDLFGDMPCIDISVQAFYRRQNGQPRCATKVVQLQVNCAQRVTSLPDQPEPFKLTLVAAGISFPIDIGQLYPECDLSSQHLERNGVAFQMADAVVAILASKNAAKIRIQGPTLQVCAVTIVDVLLRVERHAK